MIKPETIKATIAANCDHTFLFEAEQDCYLTGMNVDCANMIDVIVDRMQLGVNNLIYNNCVPIHWLATEKINAYEWIKTMQFMVRVVNYGPLPVDVTLTPELRPKHGGSK